MNHDKAPEIPARSEDGIRFEDLSDDDRKIITGIVKAIAILPG